MEIQIKIDELRQKKLFFATPMYGGMCYGLFMKSCLDLQNLFTQYGVEIKFSFIFNESLITRARNYLVDEFLHRSPDSTHFLFVDSDIAFNPQDVIALLALDKDIIGAPYAKKSIKWGNVKKGILKSLLTVAPDVDANVMQQRFLEKQAYVLEAIKNADFGALEKLSMEAGELESLTGDYVFNPVKGTSKFNVSEPLEVLEIGTGFMMIKRDVFDKFALAYPQYKYKPDHVGQAHFDGSRYIHDFFDCYIDRKEHGGNDSERYLSEDYGFCQRWRNIGGKIHLCPWMQLTHNGTYAFKGNLPSIASQLGEI